MRINSEAGHGLESLVAEAGDLSSQALKSLESLGGAIPEFFSKLADVPWKLGGGRRGRLVLLMTAMAVAMVACNGEKSIRKTTQTPDSSGTDARITQTAIPTELATAIPTEIATPEVQKIDNVTFKDVSGKEILMSDGKPFTLTEFMGNGAEKAAEDYMNENIQLQTGDIREATKWHFTAESWRIGPAMQKIPGYQKGGLCPTTAPPGGQPYVTYYEGKIGNGVFRSFPAKDGHIQTVYYIEPAPTPEPIP